MTDALRIPAEGYDAVARSLHWLVAAMVIFVLAAGIAMSNMSEGPAQNMLFDLHRSCGALLLPLMVARLLYRLTHKPPPLPDDIPPIQRLAAEATHWALYAAVIVQVLLGWVGTSAYRAPISVFWLFELPPIWPEDRAFSESILGLHAWVGITIAVLASVHIAGALFHHFVRRDTVLLRMLRG